MCAYLSIDTCHPNHFVRLLLFRLYLFFLLTLSFDTSKGPLGEESRHSLLEPPTWIVHPRVDRTTDLGRFIIFIQHKGQIANTHSILAIVIIRWSIGLVDSKLRVERPAAW